VYTNVKHFAFIVLEETIVQKINVSKNNNQNIYTSQTIKSYPNSTHVIFLSRVNPQR